MEQARNIAGLEHDFTGLSPEEHRGRKSAILGSELMPLSADERAVLLAISDNVYEQPVADVAATSRVRIGITRTALRKFRNAGLIDWEDRPPFGLCAWLTPAGRKVQARVREGANYVTAAHRCEPLAPQFTQPSEREARHG